MDRRTQNDLSRANIVRAQVIFLCSTLNDDNWEDKLQELKKVSSSDPSQIQIPQQPADSCFVVGGRIRYRSIHHQSPKIHRNKRLTNLPSPKRPTRSNRSHLPSSLRRNQDNRK